MTAKRPAKRPSFSARSRASICARLAANKRVRRSLPEWGRLHIDRQLPFLFVYRRPHRREDAGTHRLILGQASYLMTSWAPPRREPVVEVLKSVISTLMPFYGSFLVVEIWSDTFPVSGPGGDAFLEGPAFRLLSDGGDALEPAVNRLASSLKRIRIFKRNAEAEAITKGRIAPPGCRPLLTRREAAELNTSVLGVAVNPIYRDSENDQTFPVVLRRLHRGLTRAFEQGVYEFVRCNTTQRPAHYRTLGRRAVVKAVWEVDRQLARVSDAFDFLLHVTPVNADRAWRSFARSRFKRPPAFRYRPLPEDPALLKRALYKVPLERIEDPSLQDLFRRKQAELDRKITLLADRNTKRFLHGSSLLFGVPDEDLMKAAEDILSSRAGKSRRKNEGRAIGAREFAKRAQEEIDAYKAECADFDGRVEVCPDVSGLLCSRGALLVGSQATVAAPRLEAAVQHEVGTHLVTYFNGRAQPFKQLYSGLAGYEELQEGLAVLSEYACDGLTPGRMRTLAARVVAAQAMVDQATFVEVFELLTKTHGFAQRNAFTVTMRVFRGGGLTKDIVYLRGVLNLVEHMRNGGSLEPLLIGKIALEHEPVVRELLWRNVLLPRPLTPSWLSRPECAARLDALLDGTGTLATLLGS